VSYSTKEVLEKLTETGNNKAARHPVKTLTFAIMAGAYIGFAALLATTSAIGWHINGEAVFYGAQKILFGAVFSTGLMLVLIPGAELFTGNILISLSLLDKQVKVREMLTNWFLVWIGNFVGGLLLAWLVAGPADLLQGEAGQLAMKIAQGKCSLSAAAIFTRSILANWIVCLAVMMAVSAKDTAGKILAVFFPIMGFAAVGFEHSIANMYFIPVALFAKAHAGAAAADFPALTIALGARNIAIATVGNILGGALPVAALYHYLNREE
jgi:formate transporter